ncbi:MAG: DNA polymerase II [Candidatus Thermoplasmatota archaeon]|nr:DNA polymerase II [Candidatus Thermoplasmatota archaeon]
MKLRMLVISGHYRKEDQGVVIELYGRTDDGRSVTVLNRGFYPYFHIVEPRDEVMEALSKDTKVMQLKDRMLWFKGEMRRCLRVQIQFPYEVPNYRKRWQDRGYTILAADIPFINRFFYDLDLGSYLEVECEPVDDGDHTTEMTVLSSSLKAIGPFKCNLKVLSFDIENSIRTGELYMVGYTVGWLQMDGKVDVRSGHVLPPQGAQEQFEREDAIIQGLEEVIAKEDPDIITGYNIDGYDIPQLLRRCKALSIEGLTFGRDRSLIESAGFRSWRARGRVVVDAWWEAKKAFRPKKETLEAVSRLLFNEGKDDIDTSRIEEEWASRRDDVIRYCERDSLLALRVLDRTMALKKGMDLSYVAKLPLLDIVSGTTSVMIDSLLIRAADRRDIGIPLTRHEAKSDKIEGAYVHSLEPGLYKWVVVLDFRSMYPSLMIENNICFTTLTAENEGANPSPIEGVNFLKLSVRKGLVPDLLQGLLDDRMIAKRNMRSAQGSEERDYYNGLQEALKVLMNSFYGVFASYFYRFTDRSIGASITAFARKSILELISVLQKEGSNVIYSDTDSVFLLSPYQELDGTVRFGKDLSSRFSSEVRVLEFEKVFSSFFSHGKKKRYVGKLVWPFEDMVVRGYEMRRSDSFDLQSEALSELFELLLEDRKVEAVELAKRKVKELRSGLVDTQKLVISRSVQEVESDRIAQAYKNPKALANVQALEKMKSYGIELVPGMKVSWIVTDSKKKPQEVEPFLDGRPFLSKPDHNYYAARLASTLARATEVFGVDEKELLTGSSQSTLLSDFSPDGAEDLEEQGPDELSVIEEADEGTLAPPTAAIDPAKEKEGVKRTTLDQWM